MGNDSKNSTKYIIPQPINGYDIEAASLRDNSRQERAKSCHKVVIVTMMGVFLVASIHELLNRKTKKDSIGMWFDKEQRDLDEQIEATEKAFGSVMRVALFALMCFAVIREKFCLLVFGCVLEVIRTAYSFVAVASLYDSVPHDVIGVFVAIMVMAFIWQAVLLNSMIRLTMSVYAEDRS